MHTSRINHPLDRANVSPYHELSLHRQTANDEWAVILAFSGGGTRAAALSFGVLEELARTKFQRYGESRRMLDEVQSVSAVSGGSFTAAYYAVHGDRIFSDYEDVFLKRNVQQAILRRMARPQNWVPLASKRIGRSDLASDFYDQELFGGATFGQLKNRSDRPDLVLNATDMVTGMPFAFTQRNFDLIQSDLSQIPIARAVAASSAAPVVLSPVTLRNFAAANPVERPAFVRDMFSAGRATHIPLPLASAVRSYMDADDRPFVHLVDGGVSDNLGLRGILNLSAMTGGFGELLHQCRFDRVKKIAVIVVNAATEHGAEWNHRKNPGVTEVLRAISERTVRQSSARVLEDFRRELETWKDSGPTGRATPDRAFHLVEVGFEQLLDSTERAFFRNLPTSLVLPAETVDRLREVGGRLLRQSEEFRQFRIAFETDSGGISTSGTRRALHSDPLAA